MLYLLTIFFLLVILYSYLHLDRIYFIPWILIILSIIGIILVFNPILSTNVANFLGVGRGADLLLYFLFIETFSVSFFFIFKIKSIENGLTIIVRDNALKNANKNLLNIK